MTDVSVSVGAKRKHGRPRKDSNLCRDGSLQSPENPTLIKTQLVDKNSKDGSVDSSMVGSVVYGVIEGSIDAGYLISMRIGNTHTPFRSVVFQPKKFVPISSANDIAPQAKMYDRRAVAVPVYDDINQTSGFSPHSQATTLQASKQAVLCPLFVPSVPPPVSSSNHEAMMRTNCSCSNLGSGKISVPGIYVDPSLRMVEEDEVMQAFEVSTPSGGYKNNKEAMSGDMIFEPLSKATYSFPATVSMVEKNMPQSAFEIEQDGMICCDVEPLVHNGPQNATIELLQETPTAAESHDSLPKESQAKIEVQPMYYNDLTSPDDSFNQNLFTNQSQPDSQEPISLSAAQFHHGDSISKRPNLKLDLAFSVHEKKELPIETNYGYHQALVAGNSLLLPPDLMSEPLELMIGKVKSPPHCTTTPLETYSEYGENAASYKLELATPQPPLNTTETNSSGGCIADMDFVLNDAIRPAESHQHQTDTMHR